MDTAYGFFLSVTMPAEAGGETFGTGKVPRPLEVLGFRTPAPGGHFVPPGRSPGMIGMTLDGSGSVRSFYAVPRQKLLPVGAPLETQARGRCCSKRRDSTLLLFGSPAASIPPVAFDIQRAWTGTSSGKR